MYEIKGVLKVVNETAVISEKFKKRVKSVSLF
jgi:hypothetical protein